MMWDSWIEQLKALPDDAPEWEEADEFLQGFKGILAERQQRRENAGEQLRIRLEMLSTDYGDLLQFFTVDIGRWSHEAFIQRTHGVAALAMDELLQLFARYRELEHTNATTVTERAAQRKSEDEVEKSVARLCDDINSLLQPDEAGVSSLAEDMKGEGEDGGAMNDDGGIVGRDDRLPDSVPSQAQNLFGLFFKCEEESALDRLKMGHLLKRKQFGEFDTRRFSLSGDEDTAKTNDMAAATLEPASSPGVVPVSGDLDAHANDIKGIESGSQEAATVLHVNDKQDDAEQQQCQTQEAPHATTDCSVSLHLHDRVSEDNAPALVSEELVADCQPAADADIRSTSQRKTTVPRWYVEDRFDRDCTAAEIASDMLTLPINERAEWTSRLVWQLIREDKLDLAYHLGKCREMLDCSEPRIAPWLIRLAALGRHLLYAGGEIAHDLQLGLNEYSTECYLHESTSWASEWNQALRYLLAGAILRATIMAPTTGATSVLNSLYSGEGLEQLYSFQQALAKLGNKSIALSPRAFRSIKDEVARKKELDVVTREAQRWCSQAPLMKLSYHRASKVWRKWQETGELIERLLKPVCEGATAKHSEVEALVNYLSSADNVECEIQATNRKLRSRNRVDAIVGTAMDQLRSRVRDATRIANEWLSLLEARPGEHLSYVEKHASQIRDTLTINMEKVLEEVSQHQLAHESPIIDAAASFFTRSLHGLEELFDPSVPLPTSEPKPCLLIHACLLRIPGLPLDDSWAPALEDTDELLKIIAPDAVTSHLGNAGMEESLLRIAAAGKCDWQGVFRMQCDARDHEASDRILSYLEWQNDGSVDLVSIEERRVAHLTECRQALSRSLHKTRNTVENAVALGLLSEDKRASYDAILVAMESQIPDVLRFQPEHNRLQAIEHAIDSCRQAHVHTVRGRLKDTGIDQKHPAFSRIQSAIEHGDVLTANEYIDMAVNGLPLPQIASPQGGFTEFFPERFTKIATLMSSSKPPAIIKAVQNRENLFDLSLSTVPRTQTKKASDMLRAWFDVKRRRSIDEEKANIILSEIGFSVNRICVTRRDNNQWLDVSVSPTADANICPVAHYGSMADGQYRVLCLWERPGEEDMLNLIGQTSYGRATLIFYFGRVTEPRRRSLAQLCRQQERTVVVVDDVLMVYLAEKWESRLRTLFECSLPFTFCEPYTDTPGMLLAPEMFYGRVRERNEVLRPDGSCFIYGGRQLGKSSLLRDVAREFHAPEEGRVAILFDLKTKGIGYDRSVDDFWSIFAESLGDVHIIPAGVPPHTRVDTLLNHVRAWLAVDSGRRLLLLLDEADRFLEIDGKEEFARCARLKDLMENTNRRFKVVLAGLHNVQRTTRQANQPLAHFQKPICIGPLLEHGEWREARALIERPLAAMGYHLESPDLVTRILSQTNYYPNLIQLYCKELLRHVADPSIEMFDVRTTPPYIITAKHVEEAYQNQELQRTIRHKLALTLQLDQRYEVLAYSLAHNYLSVDTGVLIQGVSVSWLREQALYWWPAGFARNSSEEDIGILADEMVGLGVLRHVPPDRYALRSPNVISLLGTSTQVEAELIRDREIPAEYEPQTFRAVFRKGNQSDPSRRSPLTADQEGRLRARSNGVTVLFGSEAAGLLELEPFLELAAGREFFLSLSHLTDFDAFSVALSDLKQRQRDGTTIVYVPSTANWTRQWVESALERLKRFTSTHAFVRMVFVAEPRKTWQLINDNAERDLPQSENLEYTSLRPWHDSAVRQWLADCGLQTEPERRVRIAETTGNWWFLLRQLHGRCSGDSLHLDQHVMEIQNELEQPVFARHLATMFGLDDKDRRTVLAILAAMERASESEIYALAEDTSMLTIRRILVWAELLGLVRRESQDWALDPIVGRLLQTVME